MPCASSSMRLVVSITSIGEPVAIGDLSIALLEPLDRQADGLAVRVDGRQRIEHALRFTPRLEHFLDRRHVTVSTHSSAGDGRVTDRDADRTPGSRDRLTQKGSPATFPPGATEEPYLW